MKYTLAELSVMPRDGFVAVLDGVFEHSPWVAAAAWAWRPFADSAALSHALEQAMYGAGRAQQLQLLCAHPELAGKAAVRGELTAESNREQHGAGLDQCSPDEFADLQQLNAAYRERFGFPFVIAVRGLSRQDIIASLRARLDDAPDVALATALAEVARIARWRLLDRLA
ncbi:2-oxo-4-hydroxy-4-carboxy-5-ureidoimidazoline decarboxylase [Paludibacterium yongneupense]|uniref:2-oxo-4-hydroxy-4-carboxy-5-ureidoimidazoline decarboxylase n=1 Tax=Paludibacterium yongneupense TaxID=400061 RepID=UPI00042937BB|nr:2-oxo-4-hydroxy-4-carboxy-5-ureidoimidazoline decarboxylase [Paludibacterium yongneupense]